MMRFDILFTNGNNLFLASHTCKSGYAVDFAVHMVFKKGILSTSKKKELNEYIDIRKNMFAWNSL